MKSLRIFKVNVNVIYYILVALMVGSSLFLGMYLGFLGLVSHQTVISILKQSPYATISLLISMLNLIVGDYLWMEKDVILHNRRKCREILVTIGLAQALVGNLLVVLGTIIGYVCTKNLSEVSGYQMSKLKAGLVIAAYGICLMFIGLIVK